MISLSPIVVPTRCLRPQATQPRIGGFERLPLSAFRTRVGCIRPKSKHCSNLALQRAPVTQTGADFREVFGAPVCPTGASWRTEKIPSVCSHRPQIKASESRSFREESSMLTRLGSKQQIQAPRRFKVPQGSPLVRSRWPLARLGHALLCQECSHNAWLHQQWPRCELVDATAAEASATSAKWPRSDIASNCPPSAHSQVGRMRPADSPPRFGPNATSIYRTLAEMRYT